MNESLPKPWKETLRDLVVNLPVISDYFLHYWVFPRSSASCRDIFPSFAAASKAIPSTTVSGYDQCYEQLGFYDVSLQSNIDSMEMINALNKPIDYPVLVWLREAFKDSSAVFDLGGNTGYGYYAYQKIIAYPANLKWVICDLLQVVEAGTKLLQEIDSPGLSYTSNLKDAEGAEIFLTCGTLQYLEPSLADCLQQLTVKPRHLIVHHVPFYDGEEYFTHQNLIPAYVPYKIQNYRQFIASLEALGYELLDSWEVKRSCRIPFHPDRYVRSFHGLYLKAIQA